MAPLAEYFSLFLVLLISISDGKTESACGQPSVKQPGGISGHDATPGMWPWQIALFNYNLLMCGGALISDRWAVTAAHCLKKYPRGWTVVVGNINHRLPDDFGQRIPVRRYIMHHKWDWFNGDSDLALVELEYPAKLNERVKPVCLPDSDGQVVAGTTCYSTGWGTTNPFSRGRISSNLQQTTVNITSQSKCKDLEYPSKVTDNMMCAIYGENRWNIWCHGDGGGPLVCSRDDGRWVLQGVVSHAGSARCSGKEVFTVFTRMPVYREWIEKQMENPCYHKIVVPEGGNGTITTKNWPSPYPLNSNCIWELHSTSKHKLKMMFMEFEVGRNKYHCDHDVVEVYEDNDLYVLCGTKGLARMFSVRKRIKIVFRGNRWRGYPGFKAFYYYN